MRMDFYSPTGSQDENIKRELQTHKSGKFLGAGGEGKMISKGSPNNFHFLPYLLFGCMVGDQEHV